MQFTKYISLVCSVFLIGCGDPISVPPEITITQPVSEDTWFSWQEGYQIDWHEATATGTIRIELWKNEEKIADISDWITNTGSYSFDSVLPSDWGEGTGFFFKIIDDEEHDGVSGSFTLEDDIQVLSPESTTRWFSVFSDYEITWNETSANNVRIELWHSDSKVEDICGWITNDGEYIKQEIVDQPGGGDYRVRIIDENGFDGYSESFGFAQIAAYWPCDGNLLDASGNGRYGIVYNGTAVEDRNGNANSALRFSGNTNSYGQVSDFYAADDELTISIWFSIHGLSGQGTTSLIYKREEYISHSSHVSCLIS